MTWTLCILSLYLQEKLCTKTSTQKRKINFTASKLEEEMSSPTRDPTQSRASHSTNFAAIEGSSSN
jgi:hypothetical protein